MKAMRVEVAFFDGNTPLGRGKILVHQQKDECKILCERGEVFHITREFKEPTSSFLVKIYTTDGYLAGRSAIKMDVHNSEDWEAIDLVAPYVMCFKCTIVDCENENWDIQPADVYQD